MFDVTQMNTAILPTIARIPLRFDRGEGVWLIAEDGQRYLDFGSGIAVNSLGHAHPALVSALIDQGRKLWHCSNLFEIPNAERLAARLVERTFADYVFFANSGAEAVECAIKVARKYHSANGFDQRYRIVTMDGAFHGRTLATIAAGGQQKYMEGFGPKVDGFDQVAFADMGALESAVTDRTAGVLIEPVQGESGVRGFPIGFLRAVRDMCNERGALLIFDEVQTGIGRTGSFFAYENEGVKPDILATAKGIGGGFPIGACLCTKAAASGMSIGTHSSTFGGNPLATAIGNAVLDVVLGEGFLDRVRMLGISLKAGLESIRDQYPAIIEEIRGVGLMLGIRSKVPVGQLVNYMRDEQVLGVPAGDNVVRILPPLVIAQEEIEEGLARISRAVGRLANESD
jgi:acetylornithine/N-succinyldiaminopimelate aminotransferase